MKKEINAVVDALGASLSAMTIHIETMREAAKELRVIKKAIGACCSDIIRKVPVSFMVTGTIQGLHHALRDSGYGCDMVHVRDAQLSIEDELLLEGSTDAEYISLNKAAQTFVFDIPENEITALHLERVLKILQAERVHIVRRGTDAHNEIVKLRAFSDVVINECGIINEMHWKDDEVQRAFKKQKDDL